MGTDVCAFRVVLCLKKSSPEEVFVHAPLVAADPIMPAWLLRIVRRMLS